MVAGIEGRRGTLRAVSLRAAARRSPHLGELESAGISDKLGLEEDRRRSQGPASEVSLLL